jgi:uncharacterized protein
MEESHPDKPQATPPAHHWRPVSAIDRRVLGVLAEKAKTTPDIYPMSLNAICTGSNQKSNRAPLMQLEPDAVEESLDRLRQVGAVGLVEGYGRVQKYRHYLYEWLGVDKVEIAVMTELLLRGDQTVGELRVRASRMEPIADLAALRPVLDSLKAKGLLVPLTPEGRGHVVAHALYKPHEMETLQAKYAGGWTESVRATFTESTPAADHPTMSHAANPTIGGDIDVLQQELASLRQQIAQYDREIDEIRNTQAQAADELRQLKEALGV